MVLSNNHQKIKKLKQIQKQKTNKNTKRLCNLYLSELGTKLINDKREEEKVNAYEIKCQSIYRETNSKEMALSLHTKEKK